MSVINGIEEETLIKRFISGDQTAFELLFRFYYPGLVTFVAHIISDRDEAEEIVQDFFVNVWTARKSIQKSSSLKSYFFVSVKNRAFNYLKKEQIREKTFAQLKELVEKDILFEPDLFVESELQQQIAKALEKLPARTREILTLFACVGFLAAGAQLTIKQVAKAPAIDAEASDWGDDWINLGKKKIRQTTI